MASDKPIRRRSATQDLTGLRFGRWTVLTSDGYKGKFRMWMCLCDCGNQRSVRGAKLVAGHSQSCGCQRSNLVKPDHFWDFVKRSPSGCWEWQGWTTSDGYGRFVMGGRRLKAHRHSYAVLCGPIPEGMCVCHRCDNRLCVNPTHLFLGTPEENNRDKVLKGRTSRGTRVYTCRLTPDMVREIRVAYSAGVKSTELAARYGVTDRHICRTVSSRAWGWLT